jgi:RNA polymerase sigma-70 factor (ECF subfamily)
MSIGPAFGDVLVAARAGAGWAFEALYRDLAPVVTGYLRLHGASEPDDLASETFIGVFTGLAGFSGDEAGFRSWVFTIAHRRLIDDRRRSGRRPPLADDAAEESREHPGGNVEEEALDRLDSALVQELCGRLPAAQRTVLLLRILGDLSLEQVAEVVGASVASVKGLQRRGLMTLREEIAEDRGPLSAPLAMTGVR